MTRKRGRRQPMPAAVANVLAAGRRLAASTTALQRRNARRAVQVTVARLLREFPTLAADGQPRPARVPLTCPLCGIPIGGGYQALRNHLSGPVHRIGAHGPPYLPSAMQLAALKRKGSLQNYVVQLATAVAMGPPAVMRT